MTEPTPTIYSYYSPLVERIVRDATAQLNSSRMECSLHKLLTQNMHPGLDDLHEPLLAKYERFARNEGVIGLDGFENKYFTNGSSEAIFHLLVSIQPAAKLYQFRGEYQGYTKYASNIPRQIITVDSVGELLACEPGIVILSNPASVDGNIIPPTLINEITRRHGVILDLAYMGMTQQPLNIDANNQSILAVVGSLSKPFGLYYFRIGFCYSRDAVKSLYGNRWFKNALSIKLGERVLDHFQPRELQEYKDHYFKLQAEAVKALNELYNLDNKLGGHAERRARASDVWLLANAPYRDFDPQDLRPFKRYDDSPYRFCLTPFYMEKERS